MLTTNQSYVTYQGNGATTLFPFPFIVPSASELVVTITNNNVNPAATTMLSSSQYTVTGIGLETGGNITYPVSGSPLLAGWSIIIQRIVPYQQNTSLSNQGAFYPQVVEACLDNLTMQTQQLAAVQAGVPNPNLLATAMTQTNADDSNNVATTAFVQNQKISGGTGYVNLQYPGYGVDKTGTADSTTGIAAALATGYVVFAPPGVYKFGSSGILLNFSAGGIIGAGQNQTALISPDTSNANLITCTGIAGIIPIFRDFTLEGNASKVAGSGIIFTPSAGQLSGAMIDNVGFASMPVHLNFGAVEYFSVRGCTFSGYTQAGIQAANTYNNDAGDSQIIGNWFLAGNTTGIGVEQFSSGGLRIIGNKFNTGAYGYALGLNSANNTSILLFEGNSVENMAQVGVSFSRLSGAATFSHAIITGNEFAANLVGVAADQACVGFLGDLLVSNNTFSMSSGEYGIIVGAVDGFIIGHNSYFGSGTTYGLVIDAGASNGLVDLQNYIGVSNPFSNSGTGIAIQACPKAMSAVALSGGTANVTVPAGCTLAFATNTTAANPVRCTIIGTTLTMNGTGNDVICYLCY